MPTATEMLHGQASILRQLLVDLGWATDPVSGPGGDWPAYDHREPDAPDDVATVYNTANQQDGADMVTGDAHEQYGAQVRVRAATPDEGEPKVLALPRLLDRLRPRRVTLPDGTTYCVHCVRRAGGVICLGRESPQSSRTVWVLNVLMTIYVDG